VEIAVLFLIIFGAMVLFFTELLEVEITAILVLLSLLVTGLLDPDDALEGISNHATVVIACLLIMSAAIEKTGALHVVAKKILRFSKHNPTRIIVNMMIATGGVSMLINNTPAVAVQLPIAMSLAKKVKVSLSKILMPISFSAILGGTCTMIGTSTNVLVGSLAAAHENGWIIGIFDITPVGLIYFAFGILYMIYIGRRITPDRRADRELSERYHLREYITEIVVGEESDLVGTPISEKLTFPEGEFPKVKIGEVIRGGRKFLPTDHSEIQPGDRLLVHGEVEDLMQLKRVQGLQIRHDFEVHDKDLRDKNIVLVEGVLSPTSHLIGSTLEKLRFKQTFNVVALAIRRHGKIIRQKVGKVHLAFGDSLLLQGDREHMKKLVESPDFLILEQVKLPQVRSEKIPVTLSIFSFVVIMMATGLMHLVTAVILGAFLMIATGCITLKEIYESLPFKVIILLGCLIPMGIAMEKTGAAAFVAEKIVNLPFHESPHLILLILMLVTLFLTETITHNATAAIMVPVAFSIAAQLGISPKPLVLAVMFTASFSFLSPVGYQTNAIIYGPGGYRFSDFARVGAPMAVMLLLMSMALLPLFWPFYP